jgi:hypothetical protein
VLGTFHPESEETVTTGADRVVEMLGLLYLASLLVLILLVVR